MNVTIIGANGKIASILSELLVKRADAVSGIVRNANRSGELVAKNVTPIILDVQHSSVDDFRRAFDGADAVVWAAGAGGGDIERTYAIDRDAAIRSARAAAAEKIQQFVMISSVAAGKPDFWPAGRDYLIAKGDADDAIQTLDFSWTIIRPTSLDDSDPTGKIETYPADFSSSKAISRADVAAVIVQILERPEATKQKILGISSGDKAIDAALAAL